MSMTEADILAALDQADASKRSPNAILSRFFANVERIANASEIIAGVKKPPLMPMMQEAPKPRED